MMAATLTKLKDYWMDGHATPDDAKWRRFAQWVKNQQNSKNISLRSLL